MISFQNVSKTFGSHSVLDDVSFRIHPNEMVVLNGRSGSGKSTIVGLLIGAERPDDGMVEVDNLVVSHMDHHTLQLYRRRLGVVYQDYKLLPKKTVFENVAYPMEVCESPWELIQERVPMVLERVGLLPYQGKFPNELSGGERQRVAIARALVHQPVLLIADEPTGNLDEANSRSIIELFKALNEEGATILLTTHDPLVHRMVDGRVLTIDERKVN